MDVVSFVQDLISGVEEDPWEPSDAGYICPGHDYNTSLRGSAEAGLQLVVTTHDGKTVLDVAQKRGRDAASDDVTAKLALLYQKLEHRPVTQVAALDDVLRDIRGRRGR